MSGISWKRFSARISSMRFSKGLIPAWTAKHGLIDHCAQRETVTRLHERIPNRGILIVLHALLIESKPRIADTDSADDAERNRLSWFPRSKKIRSGNRSFREKSRSRHSIYSIRVTFNFNRIGTAINVIT